MLTAQMRKFAQEYINRQDEVQAAISAGVPKKSAKKIGSDWLKTAEVIKYIDDCWAASAEKTGLTRDFVIEEVMKILRRTNRDDIKLQAIGMLEKMRQNIATEDTEDRVPIVNIHSTGDLTIL